MPTGPITNRREALLAMSGGALLATSSAAAEPSSARHWPGASGSVRRQGFSGPDRI